MIHFWRLSPAVVFSFHLKASEKSKTQFPENFHPLYLLNYLLGNKIVSNRERYILLHFLLMFHLNILTEVARKHFTIEQH
jgi:hypothetical protein